MNYRHLIFAVAAGFLGGVLSTSLRPSSAHAESGVTEEMRAQRFTLVSQDGADLGSFTFDTAGRPEIVLRDRAGHDVWKVVADHLADHTTSHPNTYSRFHSK